MERKQQILESKLNPIYIFVGYGTPLHTSHAILACGTAHCSFLWDILASWIQGRHLRPSFKCCEECYCSLKICCQNQNLTNSWEAREQSINQAHLRKSPPLWKWIGKVQFWQLLFWSIEIKTSHSIIRLMRVRHREAPKHLCQ